MTTKIVRTKQAGQAWETTVEPTGGGGGGDDLAAVLSTGNDAGAQQITNLADGSTAQDAATLQNLNDALAFLGLNAVLSTDPDAGGIRLQNIGDGSDPTDAVTLQQLESTAPGIEAVLTSGDDANGQSLQNVNELGAARGTIAGSTDGSIASLTVGSVGGQTGVLLVVTPEPGVSDAGISVALDGSPALKAEGAGSAAISHDDGAGVAVQSSGLDLRGDMIFNNNGGSGTPVAQGAAIADATNATDVITQLNLLLAYLRSRGDIAT